MCATTGDCHGPHVFVRSQTFICARRLVRRGRCLPRPARCRALANAHVDHLRGRKHRRRPPAAAQPNLLP
eukprot:6991248-Lingulodinium_polyedra.AAC.1